MAEDHRYEHSVSELRASPGDELVVKGHHLGEPDREGEILEVLGRDGAAPFVVRWDDGHESTLFPGSDAHVHHLVRRKRRGDAAG